MVRRIVAAVLVGAALAGCAGSSNTATGPKETTLVGSSPSYVAPGTAGAPTVDAAPSGTVERGPATPPPAASSAAVGSMIPSRIGAGLDDDDKQRAYAAQVQALESGAPGAPVAWRNPDSGRYGSIVTGPTYQQQGKSCRQYTHTIYIDGKPQAARGAVCREADGSWQPTS